MNKNSLIALFMIGNIVLVVLLLLTLVSWSKDPSAERKRRSKQGMILVFFTILVILLYRLL